MTETSAARRVKTHRTLSLLLTFLALVGWAGFAYSARSAASATSGLAQELTRLTAERGRWLAEREQHRQALHDLAEARAQVSAARSEVTLLTQQLDELRPPLAATGSLEPTTRIRKADRPARQQGGKAAVP